jgi:hypothetical protein|eukprot:COSAG03_NODE_968_length_5162_cov_5.507128_4_plen_138_part_00
MILSTTPYRVVARPDGAGPSTNPELGSTGDPWLWRVELSVMRTGEHEAHASLPLGDSAAANEAVVVGDYEVQVMERVAPLCTKDGVAATAGGGWPPGASLVLTEYPLLMWHVRLQLRRLGEAESSLAEDALWDSLTG